MSAAPGRLALLAGVLACAAAGVSAQEVHKCTQDGRVTYQATPCPGDDKVLKLPSGPDEAQVELARQRAEAQKASAASSPERGASGVIRSRTTTRILPSPGV